MRRIVLLLMTLCASLTLLAQGPTVKGIVTDEDGLKLRGVVVTVNGTSSSTTTSEGSFSLELQNGSKSIDDLTVQMKGYKLLDWGYTNKARREIKILMTKAPSDINGVILDQNGTPLAGKAVKFGGQKESATTNARGRFELTLKEGTQITEKSRFLVNDQVVTSKHFKYNEGENTVVINFRTNNQGNLIQEKAGEKKTLKPQSSVIDGDVKIDPILVVVVYDEDISPADSIKVNVDQQAFFTDANGEFEVLVDSVSTSDFNVEDFEVIKKVYDYKDNYMFIHIKGDEVEEGEEPEIDYEKNFQSVFNSLESEKQLLSENGQDLRKEITKINEKLGKGSLAEEDRVKLESYLERLTGSLIENELAFEDAQFKTNQMLEKMRSQISEKDETIVKIEEEKQEGKIKAYIFLTLAVVSLIFMVYFLKTSRKLKKQRDELNILTNNLETAKNDVMKVHEEMLAVTDLGQRFTSTLDYERSMLELQDSVSVLLDAPVFGIGTYNSATRQLEFVNQVYDGDEETHYESIDDVSSFAAWCFKNEVELVINDIDKEYKKYVVEGAFDISSQKTKSLIYMPLLIETQMVGVITMQSFKTDAYKDVNISNLKSLASYAAIAVANHASYKELKHKNHSITESMRYAKSIQEAILPQPNFLKDAFVDSFLMYKSKDIVSGDFYWYADVNTEHGVKHYVAVVDCTGHGVPGALMSMIGNTLLNEIVNVNGVSDTVEILEQLNEGVKITLRQGENMTEEGMDICLIAIEKGVEDVKVQFTGAKRPLYYYNSRNQKLEALQGDVKSIGSIHRSTRDFTSHSLTLYSGDMIYLSTDGFVDQQNVDKDKIGSLRFMKVLEDSAERSGEDQLQALSNELDDHSEGVEQIDDITVLGIRI